MKQEMLRSNSICAKYWTHLRPVVDPDAANFMCDPWIRQRFNPSADKPLLSAKREQKTIKVQFVSYS